MNKYILMIFVHQKDQDQKEEKFSMEEMIYGVGKDKQPVKEIVMAYKEDGYDLVNTIVFDIVRLREMQNFSDYLHSFFTKEGAMRALAKYHCDNDTYNLIEIAIDKYFISEITYKKFEQSLFFKTISTEEAQERFRDNKELFQLYDDGSEGHVENFEDINDDCLYGVEIF